MDDEMVSDIRHVRSSRPARGRRQAAQLAALLLALSVAAPAVGAVAAGDLCATVDVNGLGPQRLAELRSLPDLSVRLELDGELFACGSEAALGRVEAGFAVLQRWGGLAPRELRLAQGFDAATLRASGAEVLASGGGFAVLRAEPGVVAVLEAVVSEDGAFLWRRILPAPSDAVLARQAANDRLAGAKSVDATVLALVGSIDAERWFNDIVTLASYERWDYHGGLLDARDWLEQQLAALPGVVAEAQQYMIREVPAYNVVATLAGNANPDEWYVVGGHFDAVIGSPGAEDNASGCAGVLELARVFSAVPPPATMVFICYSGEELGFYGSLDHTDRLVDAGDDAKVAAMLNMDMIGYTGDADLDCLLESWSEHQFLLDAFSDAAWSYTALRIVTTTYAWGSDHMPYLNAGMPALLTIENDFDSYPDYHQPTDLPVNISQAMGGEILKMNVAALARLMNAGSIVFTDGFESGALDSWTTVP